MGKEKVLSTEYNLRLAQAIVQSGPGAMIDFPKQTLLEASPVFWTKKRNDMPEPEVIHDRRFEKALGVDCFLAPAVLDYVRFPEWYFCPDCHRLQKIDRWRAEDIDYRNKLEKNKKDRQGRKKEPIYVPRCTNPKCRHVRLVPARLIMACENGHLDDFPWMAWTHARSGRRYDDGAGHVLRFESGGRSETGEGTSISCSCGASATLRGVLDKDALWEMFQKTGNKDLCCHGRHPESGSDRERVLCDCKPRALLRTASSVYYPFLSSSIVLPESNASRQAVLDSQKFVQYNGLLDDCEPQEQHVEALNLLPKAVKAISKELGGCISADEIERILTAEWLSVGDKEEVIGIDDIRYRQQEFEVLSGEPMEDDQSLHCMPLIPIDRYGLQTHGVERVVLADRLRIVKALLGYSRLTPAESTSDTGFVWMESRQQRPMAFYPGFQIFGEGIFLKFDDSRLEHWAMSEAVQLRLAILQDNLKASPYNSPEKQKRLSAKYVLLHTLSHLLIRELSFVCGYNAASLAERIYAAVKETDGFDMAGILIYTASGDAEGTLGGLVREGRPDTLPEIFARALDKVRYCANDPVCSMSHGQGSHSLNLAACYACALLPETSCECFNTYLDRGLVVGTLENKEMGFWSEKNAVAAVRPAGGKKPVSRGEKQAVAKLIRKARPSRILTKKRILGQHNDGSEIWERLLNLYPEDSMAMKLRQLKNFSHGRKLAPSDMDVELTYRQKGQSKDSYVQADVCWEKERVLLFVPEGAVDYETATDSQYQCFLLDENLEASCLLAAIMKEE